jgi:Nucleoside 2-deoxyribosyltransferase.
MTKNIYLAGPIYGCTFDGATAWRTYATKKFLRGIVGISPMRAKEYLAATKTIDHHSYDHILSSSSAITTRDKYDCTHADAILAMFPKDAPAVSVGTIMELGWASANNIPIIVVSDDPRIVDHGMVKGVAGWIVPTLDEGIFVINAIFGDYVKEYSLEYQVGLASDIVHDIGKKKAA